MEEQEIALYKVCIGISFFGAIISPVGIYFMIKAVQRTHFNFKILTGVLGFSIFGTALLCGINNTIAVINNTREIDSELFQISKNFFTMIHIMIRNTTSMMIIERIVATIYSVSYEKSKKCMLLLPAYLSVDIILGVISGIIYNDLGLPIYFTYGYLVIFTLLNLISVKVLSRINMKIRKDKLETGINLSQKYQITENVKILNMLLPHVTLDILFSALSIIVALTLRIMQYPFPYPIYHSVSFMNQEN